MEHLDEKIIKKKIFFQISLHLTYCNLVRDTKEQLRCDTFFAVDLDVYRFII